MFILTKPDDVLIQDFVDKCENADFSYGAVGGTKTAPPVGYDVDHNRRLLGRGIGDFEAAKRAIDKWKMFDFDWVRLFAEDSPNIPGKNVAMIAQHMGFYSINGCRIVYSLDEGDDIRKY